MVTGTRTPRGLASSQKGHDEFSRFIGIFDRYVTVTEKEYERKKLQDKQKQTRRETRGAFLLCSLGLLVCSFAIFGAAVFVEIHVGWNLGLDSPFSVVAVLGFPILFSLFGYSFRRMPWVSRMLFRLGGSVPADTNDSE